MLVLLFVCRCSVATALSADGNFMVTEADEKGTVARDGLLGPFKYGHRLTHSRTTYRATNLKYWSQMNTEQEHTH